MAKLHDSWTVLPHGSVRELDERLVTVEGVIPMPLGKFPRRMTVIGLSRGRSAIFSAIALGEAAMRKVEQVGAPAFLIVPNGHHRLDTRAWKGRYPKIRVLCPPGAKTAVDEAVKVDATTNVFGDKAVRFEVVDGTGRGEAALVVRRKAGTTLILNDVLANVGHPKGLGAKVMARLFGFGVKRPQVPRVVKKMLVDDAAALARQFRAWADDEQLRRIIVSHGDVIDREPRRVLREIADALDS